MNVTSSPAAAAPSSTDTATTLMRSEGPSTVSSVFLASEGNTTTGLLQTATANHCATTNTLRWAWTRSIFLRFRRLLAKRLELLNQLVDGEAAGGRLRDQVCHERTQIAASRARRFRRFAGYERPDAPPGLDETGPLSSR